MRASTSTTCECPSSTPSVSPSHQCAAPIDDGAEGARHQLAGDNPVSHPLGSLISRTCHLSPVRVSKLRLSRPSSLLPRATCHPLPPMLSPTTWGRPGSTAGARSVKSLASQRTVQFTPPPRPWNVLASTPNSGPLRPSPAIPRKETPPSSPRKCLRHGPEHRGPMTTLCLACTPCASRVLLDPTPSLHTHS